MIENKGPENVLALLMSQLKEKPHSVIAAVVSVTDGVINNTSISVEGCADEQELVLKAFGHYQGVIDGAKELAHKGGYQTE